MAKTPRPWTVTPHGPLEKLEDNLWALSSPVPGISIPRRMTMVRLGDGRIVFIDAVPMDDATLAEIRAWGQPSILVVTNGSHRIDVHAFREKLGLSVLAPAASRARVAEKVQVDGDLGALPADPALRAEPLDGVKNGEAVFVATAPSGRSSLVFSDAIMNMHRGVPWLVRLLGSSGGPKVTRLFKWIALADKAALRAHILRLADAPGLARVIPCHGDVVSADAATALRAAASTL